MTGADVTGVPLAVLVRGLSAVAVVGLLAAIARVDALRLEISPPLVGALIVAAAAWRVCGGGGTGAGSWVLRPHHARFEHRESARHEHDQRTHDEEIEGVDGVVGLSQSVSKIFHDSFSLRGRRLLSGQTAVSIGASGASATRTVAFGQRFLPQPKPS